MRQSLFRVSYRFSQIHLLQKQSLERFDGPLVTVDDFGGDVVPGGGVVGAFEHGWGQGAGDRLFRVFFKTFDLDHGTYKKKS